jgi:hypothetical protein
LRGNDKTTMKVQLNPMTRGSMKSRHESMQSAARDAFCSSMLQRSPVQLFGRAPFGSSSVARSSWKRRVKRPPGSRRHAGAEMKRRVALECGLDRFAIEVARIFIHNARRESNSPSQLREN